jgi:unsaturated chondroitin disaccharide hydrolase
LKSYSSKIVSNATNQKTPGEIQSGSLLMKRAFDLCVGKTRLNIRRLADEPKSAAWALDGNYFNFPEGFYEIGNWTSSFFTGMALIAWRQTEDEYFLNQVLRLASSYHTKVFSHHGDTHHDLGFLYSLYSVALYKLCGDQQHRDVGLRAAELLAQRFNERGDFIRAWGQIDTTEHDNMAIIDCLMNLPLLYWAFEETGNTHFYNIAVRHANMVIKHFVCMDYSVVHAVRFDLETGRLLGTDNACGYSKDSWWARGSAWAIYGLALSYSYTGDEEYLDAAIQISRAFIGQLDRETIPLWDFRLPPGCSPVRDASAAAIVVCGFQELAKHKVSDPVISRAKEALLSRLCSGDCLNFDENCPGILRSAYGDKPAYSSWGDYFLMEALAREIFESEPWW